MNALYGKANIFNYKMRLTPVECNDIIIRTYGNALP